MCEIQFCKPQGGFDPIAPLVNLAGNAIVWGGACAGALSITAVALYALKFRAESIAAVTAFPLAISATVISAGAAVIVVLVKGIFSINF